MMTTLEIILITYVCIGNPIGIMTLFIIDYIQNQRNKRNGCKKEKENETN